MFPTMKLLLQHTRLIFHLQMQVLWQQPDLQPEGFPQTPSPWLSKEQPGGPRSKNRRVPIESYKRRYVTFKFILLILMWIFIWEKKKRKQKIHAQWKHGVTLRECFDTICERVLQIMRLHLFVKLWAGCARMCVTCECSGRITVQTACLAFLQWAMSSEVSFLSCTVQVGYARLVSWFFPLCIMNRKTTHNTRETISDFHWGNQLVWILHYLSFRKIVQIVLITFSPAVHITGHSSCLFTLLVIPPATGNSTRCPSLLFFLNAHTHTTGVRKERLQTLLDCCCF